MRHNARLQHEVYVADVRRIVLTLSVTAILLVQTGGATRTSELPRVADVQRGRFRRKQASPLEAQRLPRERSSLSPNHKQPRLRAVRVRRGEVRRALDRRTCGSRAERLLLRASGIGSSSVAWAPNGHTIALSINSSPRTRSRRDLAGRGRRDRGLRRVGDDGAGFLAWSPDSRHIVVRTATRATGWHVAVVEPRERARRGTSVKASTHGWSPNGTRDRLREGSRLRLPARDSRDGRARQASPASWSGASIPRGLRMEGRIAYTRAGLRQTGAPLWVVGTTDGKRTIRWPAERALVVWSPNGRWIDSHQASSRRRRLQDRLS